MNWRYRPTEFLTDCAARYGEIFRLRTYMDGDLVMVVHPDAIQQIFACGYEQVHQPKDEQFAALLGRSSLFVLEGAAHQQLRRAVLPILGPGPMKATAALIQPVIDEELESWPLGARFSLQAALQSLLLKTTLRMLFGAGAASSRGCAAALAPIFAETYEHFASPLMLVPIGWQSRSRRGPWVRLLELADRAREIIRSEIAQRRSEITQRRAAGEPGREGADVLSQLLGAPPPCAHAAPSGLGDAEICDTLIALFMAGHDTTANALSWTFVHLLQEPALWARLVAELAGAVGRGGVDWERVLALPLLDATVREVLRLHPIFPATFRDLRQPLRILGHELPAGTRVVPCIYLAQRRPDAVPEPERFLPERFLGGEPPAPWIPFGGGVRRCVGSSAVLVQMKAVLATILVRARLRPGAGPQPQVRAVRAFISLAPSGGVPAVLVSRAGRASVPDQRSRAVSSANHLRISST
ncbi:MAG: cytochrome P450 [Polyangia bacterium]